MRTLFDTVESNDFKPLAEKMRPVELEDYFGQGEEKLLGKNQV